MGKFYWIYGNDEQSVKKRASAITADLTADKDKCDLEVISCDNAKYEDIMPKFISDLQTPPFLTPEKVIFLRYFPYSDKLSANSDDLTVTAVDQILNLDENVHVIIEGIQSNPDMRKSNAKKLKNAATAVEVIDSLKTTDKNFAAIRAESIKERLAAEGKSIAHDALKFLVDTLGSNSGILDSELEKLCTYLGKDEKKITLDICRTLCARTPESVIYFFTGALLEQNLKAALTTLSDLIIAGEAEIRIMAAVNNSITDVVKSCNAMAELGVDPSRLNPKTFDYIPADIKEQHPDNALLKMHPFRAFKVCENTKLWTADKLAKALEIASRTNLSLVSGNGNPRMVMEQMVLKICTLK